MPIWYKRNCLFLFGKFYECWKKSSIKLCSFLIFSANCDESSPVVKKYVRSLLPQISELERTEFEFEDFKYKFKLEELYNLSPVKTVT